MPSVLSFPKYLPEKQILRSYLLFYDSVSTIVPFVDQHGVEQRAAARELKSVTSEPVLSFLDPSGSYSDWFFQDASQKAFQSLTEKTNNDPKTKKITQRVVIDNSGYIDRESKLRGSEDVLLENGWYYLAMQKFPPELLEHLIDRKLAFQTRSFNHEQYPVLIEPKLGNFVMSRLARQISTEKDLSPVSPFKKPVDDLMLDGEIAQQEKYASLLAVALDVGIPSNIGSLRVGDYWDLRESFSGVRLKLDNLLDELMIQLQLNSTTDAQRFQEKVRDYADDISTRIKQAQSRIYWEDKKTFAIDIFASAAGGAVGAAFGGVPGAMVGGMIAPVVSRYGKRVSVRSDYRDVDCINQIAVMRSAIIKRAREDSYDRPNYIL